MDPNETLRLMRVALDEGDFAEAGRLAQLLDEWLSTGGFLPAKWQRQ